MDKWDEWWLEGTVDEGIFFTVVRRFLGAAIKERLFRFPMFKGGPYFGAYGKERGSLTKVWSNQVADIMSRLVNEDKQLR